MQKETKYQIEIDEFRSHFQSFQKKNMVIYGIGRRTATLLPALTDYKIIGLLDRDQDNIGKMFMEIPILSLEDAQKKADLIVINSDPTNYDTIYKRIEKVAIPVYYANGQKAQRKEQDMAYAQNLYWKCSLDGLQRMIESYDIVSFDLFDTLVMRKLLDARDVFRIVEKKIKEQLGLEIPFAALRQQASAMCGLVEPDINDIYEIFIQIAQLTEDTAVQIKHIELETELKICVPRKEMIALLKRAHENGKQVYIVSDMYLPTEILLRILKQFGIDVIERERIWISCEKKASKSSGKLWQMFQKQVCQEKKALHIGDDLKGDVEEPRKYNIDTFYVMSGREMLKNSSIGDILPQIVTLEDSLFMGLIAAKLFHNPFALCETRGKVRIDQCDVFGYCVYSGVMHKFLSWLYQQVKDNHEDRVLFFARDGYFLMEDFELLLKSVGEKNLEYGYLPISRRLIYLATIYNMEDLERVADFPFVGTFEQYMYSRFQVRVTDITKEINGEMVDTLKKIKSLSKWMEPYYDKIREEIITERKNYIVFLKREGLLDASKKDAVVDMSFYGTNQYYYQRLTGKKTDGYYFWCCHAKENSYLAENIMQACFNDSSDAEAKESPSKRKISFLESFLTAPYGMIRYLDHEGNMVCEPDKMNQQHFIKKEEMNKGVKEYMKDYFEIMGIDREPRKKKLKEILYEELVSGKCDVTENVLEGLYFDNDMVGGRELRLEI